MNEEQRDLLSRDVWTPRDLSVYTGSDYKSALAMVKRMHHVKAGRRYLVSRAVVMSEFGLTQDGKPVHRGVTQ